MMSRDIELAEQIFKKGNVKITYTKLRSLLTMIAALSNQLKQEERPLSDFEQSQADRFLIQLVYESGRDPNVKSFIEQAGLLNRTKEIKSTMDILQLHQYMEALVAYHKFYIKEKR